MGNFNQTLTTIEHRILRVFALFLLFVVLVEVGLFEADRVKNAFIHLFWPITNKVQDGGVAKSTAEIEKSEDTSVKRSSSTTQKAQDAGVANSPPASQKAEHLLSLSPDNQ
jgi:hypothetical protein